MNICPFTINELIAYQEQLLLSLLYSALLGLVISTIVGYLMPNPVYTSILNIYDL